MDKTKRLLISFLVSVILICFIIFLIYVVYSYAFYNKNEIHNMTYSFNTYDFDYVYDHLDEKTDRESFDMVTSIMFDKNKLKDIYYLYYGNSSYQLNSFYDEFFYGDKNISSDDIDFTYDGKTTLFHRSIIRYHQIHISNKNDYKSLIGLAHHVTFLIDKDSTLSLDGKNLECEKECVIDEMYGGVHEITYVNNHITYYGLVNVSKDDCVINVSGVDSLVRISGEQLSNSKVESAQISSIKEGIYLVSKCYLSDGCANKKKSYLKLFPEKKLEMYLYDSYAAAGHYYYGVYEIDTDTLRMSFDRHVYSMYDYNSGETSQIEIHGTKDMVYKIVDGEKLVNNDYIFVFDSELPEEIEEIEE